MADAFDNSKTIIIIIIRLVILINIRDYLFHFFFHIFSVAS